MSSVIGRGRAVALLVVGACGGGSGGAQPPDPIPAELGRGAERVVRLEGRRCAFVGADPASTFTEWARPGTRGNIALWGRDLTAGDTVEISVRYGDERRLVWARAIRSTLPPARTAALEQIVLEALDEVGRSDWGFRVVVVDGDVAATSPSVLCPVDIRRGFRRAAAYPRTPSARATLQRIAGLPVTVLISLDEQGRVLHVELPQTTGNSSVDQFIIGQIMEVDFAPKLHDGIPLATTVRETFRIPRFR